MASPPIDELGERLGIVLRDPEAIRQAFVHSSFLNENPGAAPGHNERLEFLGDAVIGHVVSRLLYDRFPHEDEGFLTARRAALVNRDSLAQIAVDIGLDRYILLGRGEAGGGGAARPSLLAATFEAVAGAIALSEGLARTQAWLRRIFTARLRRDGDLEPPKSAKSRLQEWTQRHHRQKPLYELLEVAGPAHRHAFTVTAVVDGRRIGVGQGSSRQRAEEAAAALTLARLETEATGAGSAR
jgi:ribonuclease-3